MSAAMTRTQRWLQVNNAGAWKSVQTLRCDQPDSANDLANAKTAVVLLATATDDALAFRIIDRGQNMQDVVVAHWDRQRGWRTAP